MPTGPQKIILIRSGRYEYAEVQLNGALQIVGPNNTGKTTLINTLQFLYLDDRRHMDFGSYTPEQTRDFYFPNQYSYVLFECLGAQGTCVLGWRGQSKTSGGDPERFCHLGPFNESDFIDENSRVREPRDVNARVSVKDFRVVKTAQEHRELLLTASGADSRGLGVVSLRDGDKYHQFRETLKCLLTLSAITQEQMRDRLLMLADIPPDRTALDVRTLFGNDYDRIRERRDQLLRFKKHRLLVDTLIEAFDQRQTVRGELIYRWTDLSSKRKAFEQSHQSAQERLKTEVESLSFKVTDLQAQSAAQQEDIIALSSQEGAFNHQLKTLADREQEFADFDEGLQHAALANLDHEIEALKSQINKAQHETRQNAEKKVTAATASVRRAQDIIANFDQLAVTELRQHFSDEQLNQLFCLLNRDLLKLPVGPHGIQAARPQELVKSLRELLARITDGVYRDGNTTIQLPTHTPPLTGLENVDTAREELQEHIQTLENWQAVLKAIDQRETLERQLRAKREQRDGKTGPNGQEIEGLAKRILRFELYQKDKLQQPALQAKHKKITRQLDSATERGTILQTQVAAAREEARAAQRALDQEQTDYDALQAEYAQCLFPEYPAKERPVGDIPNDFGAAIALFLRQQATQKNLTDQVAAHLVNIESCFGDDFHQDDERETIRLLREELEALPEKEDALARDWDAHIHGLKATFHQVLKELKAVQSAKDDLNRQFARVQVSNLKSVKIEVLEQPDLVTWITRLASVDPGGLFDHDPQQLSALNNFRTKLQTNPIIRFADLFTLGVTVERADGHKQPYHDFRQIESHGTTVAIKVLFNLLLLKRQLKRDDCQVPFFLDEVQSLDPANRHAILSTARKLGFLPITAAPEAVSEVDALYFLQPRNGWIVLRNQHRLSVNLRAENP